MLQHQSLIISSMTSHFNLPWFKAFRKACFQSNMPIATGLTDADCMHLPETAYLKALKTAWPSSQSSISKADDPGSGTPALCSSLLAANNIIITPGVGLLGRKNRVSSGEPPPSSSYSKFMTRCQSTELTMRLCLSIAFHSLFPSQ